MAHLRRYFVPLPACQVKAAQSVLQGSQAVGHLGYRAVAAGPEDSGRCRSLTVKPSLAVPERDVDAELVHNP